MRVIPVLLLILLVNYGFGQSNKEELILTNESIITLQGAGLSKDVILAKIKSSKCNFDLSTNGLLELKKANVPNDVITAMLSINNKEGDQASAGTQSLTPGIYYQDGTKPDYIECDPSILTNQKSGGLGEVLKRSVSGLFNAKTRASLSGREAQLTVKSRSPVFLFVFDSTAKGFNSNNTLWSNAESPNEFFLVKLTVVKNSREVVVSKGNAVSSDIGISDEMKVRFTSKKLQKGVYEVSTERELLPGEYCFMFAASSMYMGVTHKVYDFSVK